MPTEPKGQRRAAGAVGNAIKVARIAAGEEAEDKPADDGKDVPPQPWAGRVVPPAKAMTTGRREANGASLLGFVDGHRGDRWLRGILTGER